MLTLYFRPTCPYCQKVRDAAAEMGIEFDLKDISADDTSADELIEKGGKRQVPYLVDTDRGVEMYESGDILMYLKEQYG